MNCLFPTMLEGVREKYADNITTINDDHRFPYPALRIVKAVNSYNTSIPDDKYFIHGMGTYVLPWKLGESSLKCLSNHYFYGAFKE
jgi:hypothetical protein